MAIQQQTYRRPEPTKEEAEKCIQLTTKITNGRSMQQIRIAVAAIMVENIRLARECNEHRVQLGFEPLPLYHEA